MTLTFHLEFILKTGENLELDCRHTAIWMKRRNKWLIVHEHISAPLPA
jgi:ketosteroid isomerase-like protein